MTLYKYFTFNQCDTDVYTRVLSKSHTCIDSIILIKKNNGNKTFMQNNSGMTRSLRPCPLDQCFNW